MPNGILGGAAGGVDAGKAALIAKLRELTGGMDTGDKLTAASMMIPSPVGDAIGVANDVRNMATGREDITPANIGLAAAGAIPGIPSGLGMISKLPKSQKAVSNILNYHFGTTVIKKVKDFISGPQYHIYGERFPTMED